MWQPEPGTGPGCVIKPLRDRDGEVTRLPGSQIPPDKHTAATATGLLRDIPAVVEFRADSELAHATMFAAIFHCWVCGRAPTHGDGANGLVIGTEGLHQRLRLAIHEGYRFLIVGGIGTVMTIGGAVALQSTGKYAAVTIATFAATIFSFLGNRYWTFRHREGQGATQEGTLFFLLNGVGLLIYYGCIWIIQDLMGLHGRLWYTAALIVGTGLGTVFRFWSYRKWVWTVRHRPQRAGAEFARYPEHALAGSLAAVPVRAASAAPGSRPPGRSTARHAAPARAPAGRFPVPVRSRPGAHRRS